MFRILSLTILLTFLPRIAVSLPPPKDIPEELLRTEIITEGRSPTDGKPVTASEYAEIQLDQATHDFPPTVSADLQQTIFLLRLLKLFKTIKPF